MKVLTIALIALLALSSCGRKGDPLPPATEPAAEEAQTEG